MKKKILIIEDESDIITLLTYNLSQEGFEVHSIQDGDKALQCISSVQPDLILLDIMLPGKDGFEICRQLTQHDQTKNIPIIMISAKSQEHNIVTGLELGARDYITKPFSINILVARIRAVLRHANAPITLTSKETVLRYKSLVIYPLQFDAYVEDNAVDLNATEFKLLECLVRKPDWVLTRNQLIDACKGENYIVNDRLIDVMIVSIRKKLGAASHCIQTVRGVGYRFRDLECAK